MIQFIGITEVLLFYIAYIVKLLQQNRRGIKTNQLGIGKKPVRTVIIERLLRVSSTVIVVVIVISAIINTKVFTSLMIRGIGLGLLSFGTIIFIIAMTTMKDSWRAGIPDNETTSMVTVGVYKVSRNPAFLGFDLTYLGACFAFGNLAIFLMTVSTIILMHLQILEEEKYLESTFGNDYITYKNKVARYFVFL